MARKLADRRKITLWVPTQLLEEALASGDGNITETVKKGLSLLAASKAYAELKKMRGRVKLRLNLAELRADRP
jgi:hypothetical protein